MDDGTNFLSVKRGKIILKLIFSILFKANCEECLSPSPAKKARVDEPRPSIIKYAGPTPKQVLSAQVQPSLPATIQSGQKPKREWAASYNMVNPAGSSMQDREIAGPVAQEHSDAAPSTLQHSLPGPSGAQVQPGYKPVSIFSYLSISSNF